jgi:hypothetical protein
MCIPNQNYLLDILDTVLTWDLSDEVLVDVICDQLKLKEGISPDES